MRHIYVLVCIIVALLTSCTPPHRAAPIATDTTPKPRPHGVIILNYHRIIDEPKSIYDISTQKFEQQIKWLSDHGYQSIAFDQLEAVRHAPSTPSNRVLFTFDDGYASQYTAAIPILERYGFHATLFIIAQQVDQAGYMNLKRAVGT